MQKLDDNNFDHGGDRVIVLAAQCIAEIFGDTGDCYRIGGDEFCVIRAGGSDVPQKLEQFDALLQRCNDNPFPVSVSHGWEMRQYKPDRRIAVKDLIELKTAADKKLYQDKLARRQG